MYIFKKPSRLLLLLLTMGAITNFAPKIHAGPCVSIIKQMFPPDYKALSEEFKKACEENNLDKVEKMLKPIEEDPYYGSQLRIDEGMRVALSKQNKEVAQYLFSNVEPNYFYSALDMIESDAIRFLFTLDIPKKLGVFSSLLLKSIIYRGDIELAEEAIKNGVNLFASLPIRLDYGPSYMGSALAYAAWVNNIQMMEWLHDKGLSIEGSIGNREWCADRTKFDVDSSTSEQNGDVTPLHVAAVAGNLNIVKWLISHGANVDSTDIAGRTPIGIITAMAPHRRIANATATQKSVVSYLRSRGGN